MDTDETIKHAESIISKDSDENYFEVYTEATEFLRRYAGEKSSLYLKLAKEEYNLADNAKASLRAFISLLTGGHLGSTSLKREAEIDVVSDFLEQATYLLKDKKYHPAAPAVIIGASLEEFLRNWVEEAALSLDGAKPSLDSYARSLRKANLIDKQDMKNIVSWSGIRNDAAHGDWEKVKNRESIDIMLQGVNLFMMKYGKS